MCTINVLKFVLNIPHYFVCESFYKLTKNFYNESGSQPQKNHRIDQDINKQKGHERGIPRLDHTGELHRCLSMDRMLQEIGRNAREV